MIKINSVSIKYVKDYYSLYNVNLQIDGHTLLIGEEASGNNFLLRILAKIDKGYDGEIIIDNIDLKQIKDKDLNLAYIPQTPCLFENKSVIDNLIYPLKIRKIKKIEAILRAKTAIKPYFLKIFEIFNKTNTDKNNLNNNLNDNDYNKSYNDDSNLNFNKEEFENNFEKFLNIKVKKLDVSTKKIIALLRAKIREPKYILIENFFENLNKEFFELSNEIISVLKTKSTIVATQNNDKIIPAYNNFKQIFFDAGRIIK